MLKIKITKGMILYHLTFKNAIIAKIPLTQILHIIIFYKGTIQTI